MRAKEMVFRAAEGETLGPAGEGPRVVQLEVYKDDLGERAILYVENGAGGGDDLSSRVYFGQDIPAWVRAVMIAVLELEVGP